MKGCVVIYILAYSDTTSKFARKHNNVGTPEKYCHQNNLIWNYDKKS